MFGEEELKEALKAYKMETSPTGKDEFTSLRKNNSFFKDVRSREDIESQIKSFVGVVSNMDRDRYSNRYVFQTFLLDFCRYLDKDFLFSITDGKTFFQLKDRLKELTGEIYETNKKFTQNVGLNSMEHLLEDYGTLLKFARFDIPEPEEGTGGGTGFGSLFEGDKLW
jgi:hypothetical protein